MTLDEAAYYHAVEDFFAALRGGPHTLSPKDIHLLRTWWREGVPLAAVTTGITEAVARRRERGEEDPVVSLSYCRHAVKRQAKQLAELRAGGEEIPAVSREARPAGEALAALAARLEAAAAALEPTRTAAATVVARVATEVRGAVDLPPAAIDQHLFSLEAALLSSCWRALSAAEAAALAEQTRCAAEASGATGDAAERTYLALRDRALRERLGLPRLELE